MKILCFYLVVTLFATLFLMDGQLLANNSLRSDASNVVHFAYFSRDRDKIRNHDFLSIENFAGAQVMYAWKELEPAKGEYDFSLIKEDLNLLNRHRKKLFIQLQDVTFLPNNKAVPTYILQNPEYNGGADPQYNDAGEIEGWVARRWDPSVRKRFHLLIKELAKEFDGKIYGINLQETAIRVELNESVPVGFSYPEYRNAILENMNTLNANFQFSIKMQYANFMPGEWLPWEDQSYLRSIYYHAKDLGIHVGSPDLMPHRIGHQNHAHHFMKELRGQVNFGIAVQDGNYHGDTGNVEVPDGERLNIVPELFRFATDDLGVKIIFWGIQEPYFSEQVIPFVSGRQ